MIQGASSDDSITSTSDSHSKSSTLSESLSGPELWIILYFVANLFLTIHNKWILGKLNFRFPWTLTALHISISGIGSYFFLLYILRIQPTSLSTSSQLKLFLFSILYAINIAISNVSLAHVSLAFHQLVRSTTPVFTIAMEYLVCKKTRDIRTYLTLLPVVLGVSLATVDEFTDVTFTATGLILTFLGVLLSSAKGVVTNQFMVGSLKLHPLELIWRMSIPSVIQCLIYGWLLGELSQIPAFFIDSGLESSSFNYSAASKLLLNGTLAMILNFVSFTANKKTSALTMTVAGNIKQALSIILAIYIFNTRISTLNILGAGIALAGGAWYSYEAYLEQYKLNASMRLKFVHYDMVQVRS